MDNNNMNNGDFNNQNQQYVDPNQQYNQNQQYVDPNQQYSNQNPYVDPNVPIPGKGAATASLVLGIISIVFWFFGYGAIIGLILGIIGLILNSNAKKAGFVGGIQTGGFVCSLIGVIGSALVFVACIACVGALGAAGLEYWAF